MCLLYPKTLSLAPVLTSRLLDLPDRSCVRLATQDLYFVVNGVGNEFASDVCPSGINKGTFHEILDLRGVPERILDRSGLRPATRLLSEIDHDETNPVGVERARRSRYLLECLDGSRHVVVVRPAVDLQLPLPVPRLPDVEWEVERRVGIDRVVVVVEAEIELLQGSLADRVGGGDADLASIGEGGPRVHI